LKTPNFFLKKSLLSLKDEANLRLKLSQNKENYLCTPYFYGKARKCRQVIYLLPMVTGFGEPVLSFNGLICFFT